MKTIYETIWERLKECDTVTDYMTKEEAVEYYKKEYPDDYKVLMDTKGE